GAGLAGARWWLDGAYLCPGPPAGLDGLAHAAHPTVDHRHHCRPAAGRVAHPPRMAGCHGGLARRGHRASQPGSCSPSQRTRGKALMQNKSPSPSALNPAGLANLAVVYLVWSSTYLAIRIAVREGAGFPPFTMGLMRAALGGALLILWAYLQKQRVRITRREMLVLFASGTLLWMLGNGLVAFAEQRTASGLAALLLAATPIWTALIEAIWDRKLPS